MLLHRKSLPKVIGQALALLFAQNGRNCFYKFDRVFYTTRKNMTNVM